MKRLAILCLSVVAFSGSATADPIRQACLKSDRSGGNGRLCGCIQQAANMTLTVRDQELAASFFTNPHKAQEVRQSSKRSMEHFWERYKNFGATAESICRS